MKRILAFGTALALAAGAVAAQERVALVIGNGDYENAPDAQTAVRDARRVAQALEQAGWKVTLATDLDRAEMRQAFDRIALDRTEGDVVVYYAGHALRSAGRTYLAPVDQAAESLVDVLFGGVPLELVLRLAEGAEGQGVALLDVAQLEGFEPTPFVEPGLESVEAPAGVIVVSAAPPGQAIRRSPDRDSSFARLITDRLLAPNAPLMATVEEAGAPTWTAGEATEDFVLAPPPEETSGSDDLEKEIELAYWRTAERSGKAADYRAYLERYPDGVFAEFARDRLDMDPDAQLPDQPQVNPAVEAENALNLSRIRVRQVQQWLRAVGNEPGSVDGLMGPNTREALRRWQRAEGFETTGYLNREQLDRLSDQGEQALDVQRRREEQQRRVSDAQDNGYWQATGADGTADGLRAYLERYPDGLHADEARDALEAIADADPDQALREERQAYTRARRADTAGAYREYLAAYPQGIWQAEARSRIDEIEDAERVTAEERRLEQNERTLGLNAKDRQSIEQRLRSLGYNPGPLDGEIDARTRAAIEGYQASRGIQPTGYLDRSTVVGIVQETNQAQQGALIIDGTDVVRGLIESLGGAVQGTE